MFSLSCLEQLGQRERSDPKHRIPFLKSSKQLQAINQMFLSDSSVIGSLLDAEKILSNPSDVHEEWKPDASTVGGDFFRAGGA